MMMQEPAARRSVIVQRIDHPADVSAETTLLHHMGHDVASVSPDEALTVLRNDEADLVVIDIAGLQDREEFVDRLSELLASRRQHRHVAVFANEIDDNLTSLRGRTSPKLHLFLRPLHLHGLLNVLKSIDSAGGPRNQVA